MTIDEIKERLDQFNAEITEMSNELDGIDKSDLSATNKHYVEQAIKLMHTACNACEEAASYLSGD